MAQAAESDNAADVQSAGAEAAFVASTILDGFQSDPRATAPNVQSTDPFGAVHLVSRKRQQINVVRFDIRRHLAHPLGGIGMEHRAVFLADFANAGNLVDGAQFVVRPHDGHQNGVVSKGVLHHLGRDDAIRAWFQERHIKAFTFQAAARVDDGFVFVHRGDDVSAMFGASGALAYIRAAPLMAMLFDSVAPEVKMISFGWAPRRSATCDRAVSTPFSASQPYAWFRLLELP